MWEFSGSVRLALWDPRANQIEDQTHADIALRCDQLWWARTGTSGPVDGHTHGDRHSDRPTGRRKGLSDSAMVDCCLEVRSSSGRTRTRASGSGGGRSSERSSLLRPGTERSVLDSSADDFSSESDDDILFEESSASSISERRRQANRRRRNLLLVGAVSAGVVMSVAAFAWSNVGAGGASAGANGAGESGAGTEASLAGESGAGASRSVIDMWSSIAKTKHAAKTSQVRDASQSSQSSQMSQVIATVAQTRAALIKADEWKFDDDWDEGNTADVVEVYTQSAEDDAAESGDGAEEEVVDSEEEEKVEESLEEDFGEDGEDGEDGDPEAWQEVKEDEEEGTCGTGATTKIECGSISVRSPTRLDAGASTQARTTNRHRTNPTSMTRSLPTTNSFNIQEDARICR